MRVLIVYAHPEPKSFNGAMRDVAVAALGEAGHTVSVSDLYAMDFHAVAGRDDISGELVDYGTFNLAREQIHAMEKGTLAPDIVGEQRKLRQADLVIFQFPIWWFGMPAILKGWADRVMTRGFAYAAGRKYDTGLFKGKRAMVSITTGTSEDTYAPDGIDGDILSVLWPVHNGLFRYCGFDVIEPFVAYMPGRLDDQRRADLLARYRKRFLDLEHARELFFHPSSDYGPDERLKPGIAIRSAVQRRP